MTNAHTARPWWAGVCMYVCIYVYVQIHDTPIIHMIHILYLLTYVLHTYVSILALGPVSTCPPVSWAPTCTFLVFLQKRVCLRSSWVNASCTNDATLADCNKPAVPLVFACYAHMYVCMTKCIFAWVCERGGPRAPGTVLWNVDLSLGNSFNSAVDLGVSWSSEISAL